MKVFSRWASRFATVLLASAVVLSAYPGVAADQDVARKNAAARDFNAAAAQIGEVICP